MLEHILYQLAAERGKLFGNSRVRLALWMGSLSLLSLLKSQPSHYVFPAAAFLTFFMAQTLCSWWRLKSGRRSAP